MPMPKQRPYAIGHRLIRSTLSSIVVVVSDYSFDVVVVMAAMTMTMTTMNVVVVVVVDGMLLPDAAAAAHSRVPSDIHSSATLTTTGAVDDYDCHST
jgi:hypothetical protein